MAHHKHRHIKREKQTQKPFWIRDLTKEETIQMDADALLMSLGKSYMNPRNWDIEREKEIAEIEFKTGQRVLAYDPETNSGVLGCATQIDNGAWQ